MLIFLCCLIGFGNNFSDWTSMDPAIVSFRQFSQFNPQQQQQQPQAQNQPNNNDLFQMSQMNQQGKVGEKSINFISHRVSS
jgi:hypothetical protein